MFEKDKEWSSPAERIVLAGKYDAIKQFSSEEDERERERERDRDSKKAE